MSLRDQLQTIYDEYGRLTPELVVQTARPKNHPLHARVFDRVPEHAAEAWYRYRAHELIQSVRVVYKEADESGPSKSVRAYQAVPAPEGGFDYKPSEEVAADPLTKQIVLRQMEREWKQMVARYGQFKEFAELVNGDLAEVA